MEKESRVFEQQEQQNQQEKIKKLDTVDAQNLTNKIQNIEKRLNKFGGNGKEFFEKIMNDYLQDKFGAKFENKNGKLVLIIDKNHENLLNELEQELKITDNAIFVDKNKNGKLDIDEIGVNLNSDNLEANSIYVDKKEQTQSFVKFQKDILGKDYTEGGKLIFENGKVFYQVGENKVKEKGVGHYDHLAAVARLFTALSEEFFEGKDLKQLNKEISNLYYNPKTGEFDKFSNFQKAQKKGFTEHPGDIYSKVWWKIVKPGAKINLTSLSEAISKPLNKEVKNKEGEKKVSPEKEKSKEINNKEFFGRFYESINGEVWDIPDKWKIDYKGYSASYSNLDGSKISISAANSYDFENKGNNQFSLKKEINLENGKVGYLVVGENFENRNIDLNSLGNTPDQIRKNLENSKMEAWFVQPKENGNYLIEEVGDPSVQIVNETSDKVEMGEDKDHPIIIEKNTYSFSGAISGEIKFKTETKDNKSIVQIDSITPEIKTQKDFNKIFPGGKGYLLVNNHLVELTFNKNDKKVNLKDLGEQKSEYEFFVGGVSIFDTLGKSFEFNKETGHISFPKMRGWGVIEGNLKKEDGKINFSLDKKFNIADRQINISFTSQAEKLKPNEILKKTIEGLLLLGTEKLSSNEKLGDNTIKVKEKSFLINLDNVKDFSVDKISGDILTYQKGENEDTYIIDAIKKKVETEISAKKQSQNNEEVS